jgi:voltage-gated sodium channel
MFLVFYVFAIFAIMLFKTNDPWHFENLHITIMTLFRVATGDDWTDIMYTAQFGCKYYGSSVATLPDGTSSCGDGTYPVGSDTPYQSEAHGLLGVLFFSLFQMLGGMVFLNLFTGVITAGMYDSMGEQDFEALTEEMVEVVKCAGDVPVETIRLLNDSFSALDLSDAKVRN